METVAENIMNSPFYVAEMKETVVSAVKSALKMKVNAHEALNWVVPRESKLLVPDFFRDE